MNPSVCSFYTSVDAHTCEAPEVREFVALALGRARTRALSPPNTSEVMEQHHQTSPLPLAVLFQPQHHVPQLPQLQVQQLDQVQQALDQPMQLPAQQQLEQLQQALPPATHSSQRLMSQVICGDRRPLDTHFMLRNYCLQLL